MNCARCGKKLHIFSEPQAIRVTLKEGQKIVCAKCLHEIKEEQPTAFTSDKTPYAPYGCTNIKCPNTDELSQKTCCPTCGRESLPQHNYVEIQKIKRALKESGQLKKCPICKNFMTRMKDPGSVGVRYIWTKPAMFFPINICRSCNISLLEIPEGFLEILVGKIVKGKDSWGLIKFRVESPKSKQGIQLIHCPGNVYLNGGDSAVFCGYQELDDKFTVLYYRNLTAKMEGFTVDEAGRTNFISIYAIADLPEQPIDFRNWHRINTSFSFMNPLFEMAKQKLLSNFKENINQETINIKIANNEFRENAGSFELVVASLLQNMGYKDVTVTGGAGDRGTDIMIKLFKLIHLR